MAYTSVSYVLRLWRDHGFNEPIFAGSPQPLDFSKLLKSNGCWQEASGAPRSRTAQQVFQARIVLCGSVEPLCKGVGFFVVEQRLFGNLTSAVEDELGQRFVGLPGCPA